ncbi:MAG: lectin-like protein [Promethearchaeota archaeon]
MKAGKIAIILILLIVLVQTQGFLQGSYPSRNVYEGRRQKIETNSHEPLIYSESNLGLPSASIKETVEYVEQNPLEILNDSAFGPSGYNFTGTGTVNDPYLISGYNITSSSGPLIHVANTTKYFRISNNLLKITHGGTFYKGSEYKLYPTNVTYPTAMAACTALGGHLVTISDWKENTFVTNLAQDAWYIWIGLTDEVTEGTFKWITGEPFVFYNWLKPNPNDSGDAGQDHVVLYGGLAGSYDYGVFYSDATGGWNDVHFNYSYYYICEWEFASIDNSIWVNNVTNGEILENIFTNAKNGVHLENTNNISIVNNMISNHSSHAIVANQSNFNNYSNNIIYNGFNGIIMDNSSQNTLSKNSISVSEIGITFKSSTLNNLSENTISDCISGFYLESSNSTNIVRNTFYDCLKTSIDLQSSTENVIAWNNFFLGRRTVIFNGHKYLYFIDERKYWKEAKTACEPLGGHLVTITHQNEYDFVFDLLGGGAIWLGLTDEKVEGTFEWITGEYVTFADPLLADGSGDYILMWTGWAPLTWNDVDNEATQVNPPGVRYPYICEWDFIDYVIDIGSGNNTYQYNYWESWEGPDDDSNGIHDIPYRLSNHGLSFDGTNDYAELSNYILEKNFTIEFWVNIIDTTSFQCIICKETSAGSWIFLLMISQGSLVIYDRDSSVFLDLITSGWQHFAIIIEEGSSTFNYHLYRNGVAFISGSMDLLIGYNPTDKPWTIGQEWDWPETSDHLKGAYDDLRFVNRSLTSVEIYEDYTSPDNNYPARTGTVAWYQLNETSGTSIQDSSGHGNHGTTYNGAGWKQAVDSFPRITPIWIDDNNDFPNFSSSGDGTLNKPYKIENHYFVSNHTNLIEIHNTTAYFVIQNSFFDSLEGSYDAIYLKNVTNGWIQNNELTNGYYGIQVELSESILIERNFIFNGVVGMTIQLSVSNHIKCNMIYNNIDYGIKIDTSSENNIVEWNIILNNNQTGHQAYDKGIANVFRYNYWNDWTSPDDDIDGFVDDPYDIDGGNNQDFFPVATEVPLVKIISPIAQFYDIDTVSVILSGNAYHYIYYIEGVDSSNQTWSSSSSRTLDDGSYILHVYGSDPLDKYTIYESVSFTIDTILPSIDISSPIMKTYTQKSITLSYTVSDATDTHATIYINDVANTTTIPSGITSHFPNGDYNITIIIVDQAGNIGTANVIFTVDAEPPTISIDSPVKTTYTTGSIMITLSGDDVVNYWYYIVGVDSVNQTWASAITRSLPNGTYTLHAYGNDSAGNEVHESVIFVVEIPPMTTSLTSTGPTTTPPTTTTGETKSEDDLGNIIGMGAIVIAVFAVLGGFYFLKKKR